MLEALKKAQAKDQRVAAKKPKKQKAANDHEGKNAADVLAGKPVKATPKAPKPRRMAFTPSKVDVRIAKNGKEYIYSRGTIVYRRKSFTYTVMVPFFQFHKFSDAVEAMQAGTSIEIEGTRQQMTVTNAKGKTVKGGIYIEANRLLGVLDGEHGTRGSDEPSRTLPAHERKGHYRRQHYGPNNSQVKVIWIDDVSVNEQRKAA